MEIQLPASILRLMRVANALHYLAWQRAWRAIQPGEPADSPGTQRWLRLRDRAEEAQARYLAALWNWKASGLR